MNRSAASTRPRRRDDQLPAVTAEMLSDRITDEVSGQLEL